MYRLLLTFLFLLLLSTQSFTQDLLTLEEAIKTALKNNYSIQVAENEKEIAANNASIGNAGFLPTLDGNASYTESFTDVRQEYLDGRVVDRSGTESSNLSASLALNWTVFDGFRMFASLSRLKNLRNIGEENFKIEIENNITDIISFYYNITRQQSILEVINRNIQISRERVDIAEAKLKVGSGSKFELRQAQIDYNTDRSQLLREELNLYQSKVFLNQLLGTDINNNFSVTDTIVFRNNLLLEDLKFELVRNNTRLKIAKENMEIAESDLSLAWSGIFPRINLFSNYSYSESQSEANFLTSGQSNGFSYGASASINLFNGLNTRRNIENANIVIENAEYLFKEVELSVNADLLNAYKRYQNSLEIIELEKESLTAAEENVNIVLERLRLGTITPLEFREAQINLFNAQSRLLEAQYEAKTAETDLLRLSGQLIMEFR